MKNSDSGLLCRDFVVRGLRALDTRDYDALASAFAEEGVWDRGGESLIGPKAVLAAMAKRPVDLETQHLAFNMIVDMEGAHEATVRYTIAAYAQMSGKPYHLHGIFLATDRLTFTDDGWRYAHRTVAPAFSAQT